MRFSLHPLRVAWFLLPCVCLGANLFGQDKSSANKSMAGASRVRRKAGIAIASDPNLAREISKIPIFDNHSHPGFADDPDVDAMTSPPGSSAFRLRPDNPELVLASKALFSYQYNDYEAAHARELTQRKDTLKRQLGKAYFDRILDELGIEKVIANRVAMPDYLDRKRFLWACFADSFLFPFDNRRIRDQNVDEQTYLPLQEKKLQRELRQAGRQGLPDSLSDYLQFVSRVLEQNRADGAVAVKFEAAYFRSLSFGDPTREEAEAIYANFWKSGVPSAAEYKVFQDFIFRHILRESGRLHMAVHFHSSVGVGDYFSLQNGNVLNLENVLRDPRYDSVKFVLLHGGFPNDRQAIWLAARKNVYVDSSFLELLLYPSEFKNILKYWLTIFPDKVLYGSDAFPFNDVLGAEESYWLAVRSARSALASALSELVSEHALTREQALKMARGYLHDNAASLYK